MKKLFFLLFLSIPAALLSQNEGNGGTFIPDTKVNSKIELLNPGSVLANLGDISKNWIQDEEQTRVYIQNKSRTEYFILYHLPGANKNAYSEFEIGYVTNLPSLTNLNTRNIKRFYCGQIKLGTNIAYFKRIKGQPAKEEKDGENIILIYKITNESNALLKRYNMPAYAARYTFKDNKLINIRFGFPYL